MSIAWRSFWKSAPVIHFLDKQQEINDKSHATFNMYFAGFFRYNYNNQWQVKWITNTQNHSKFSNLKVSVCVQFLLLVYMHFVK